MLRTTLTILAVGLCVDSLSLYSQTNPYIVNAPENEESNSIEQMLPKIPPPTDPARVARYIVHASNWTVASYKSQQGRTLDFPMGTILSVSDGPVENGKGIPYVYVTELEEIIQDTDVDPRCSFTFTLAEGDYCKQIKVDPQNPICPQVTLVGVLGRILNGSEEEAFARNALFTRHPSMKIWPPGHNFFFMKLVIAQIFLLDSFGGPVYVSEKDYFNATLVGESLYNNVI